MQNKAFEDINSHYYTRVKSWMVPFFEDRPNMILDLGCGAGALGQKLIQAGKVKALVGAEIFPAAAEQAAKIYQHVHVGDLEQMRLDYPERFDYVVCGDILEHLKDPYTMVQQIFNWLRPGGSLLVCVPNVRNFRLLNSLVFTGNWEYVSSGILDRTHLRFFTRRSCERMLVDAGFEVYHSHMVVEGPKKTLLNRVTLGLFDEFLAAQLFCCGRKSHGSGPQSQPT